MIVFGNKQTFINVQKFFMATPLTFYMNFMWTPTDTKYVYGYNNLNLKIVPVQPIKIALYPFKSNESDVLSTCSFI